jgi:hypothetical protein
VALLLGQKLLAVGVFRQVTGSLTKPLEDQNALFRRVPTIPKSGEKPRLLLTPALLFPLLSYMQNFVRFSWY